MRNRESGVNPEHEKQNKEAENLPENVVELETENAHYRIVYNMHGKELPAETVQGTDGIILELVGVTEESADDYTIIPPEKIKKLYGNIYDDAFENQTPIFFVDVSSDLENSEEIQDKDRKQFDVLAWKGAIGFFLGANVAVDVATTVRDKSARGESLSRRKFLGMMGKTAAGAYLASPGLEILSSMKMHHIDEGHPDESGWYRKADRALRRFNRKLHPESRTTIVEGRNFLFAQKAETLAKAIHDKTEKKPELAIVVGAAHTGVEEALVKTEQERQKELEHYFAGDLKRENMIFQVNPQLDDQGRRKAEVIPMIDKSIGG